MKISLSLILSISLFLSACSTLTDVASGTINDVAKSTGVSKIGGATESVKKVVIPKDKNWNDGDAGAGSDIVYGLIQSDKYIRELKDKLLSYSEYRGSLSIHILRTSKVQGISYIGSNIRITRGMCNMIYDEAELACLIGHEIGHNASKDAQKEEVSRKNNLQPEIADTVIDTVLSNSEYKYKIRNQQRKIISTNWSREAEKAADKYGAELAAKAGYDPYAFCDLFERLASRIDLGLVYKFQKLEGSHPALDDRAKSLREYLKKKGYTEGMGKRNRQEYLAGMREVHAMRTGEGKKEDKKIQKEIDVQGKKDLKRLDEIFKEVESLEKSISMKRFIEIMDELSAICKKYGVTAEDVFANTGASASFGGSSFMEESIEQDSPFWEMLKNIKGAIAGKVGNILGLLGRLAIGSTPVIGDVIDVYELISGKDFFTGEKLTALEKALTAFGLLVGSGSTWRAVAKGIDGELASLSGKTAVQNISEARAMLKAATKDVEVCGDWKRLYSRTVNKGFIAESLPYRSGMSAFEGTTKNNEVFYRVFSNNMEGSWLIRFNPKGMAPKELQEILALPKAPTQIAKVKVPAGIKIRVGNAGEIKDFGKGGATQWEIIKTQDQSYKDLGIIFENIGKL